MLVCAPTGAGKTVVGEFAVHLALAEGRKCFYTTPIKALSNQKYDDLVDRYGAERGRPAHRRQRGQRRRAGGRDDHRGAAQHALRRLRRSSTDLGYVVMDEVHYLADRFRGAVWEEVIIHLPESVALVCLSATVSNAEEFGDWLVTVRGDTTVVVDEHRPVPLWQHMLVGTRLFDLFAGGRDRTASCRSTRSWSAHVRELERQRRPRLGPGAAARPAAGRAGFRPPSRIDVIDRLDRDGLLPAITFIFSRAGCDAAVAAVRARRAAADRRGRGGRDPRDRRASTRPSCPRTTWTCSATGSGATALRARDRRAPRRAAPGVQGDRRGAVRPRAGQGRLRHRDAGAGHQHAGPHRGARAAGQVQRRDARRRDAGGVHPAHRAGRPPRHRRRGPRRRALAARGRPGAGRRAGLDPHLPAALARSGPSTTWPSTSSGSSAPAAGPRAARALVRAVPGRPGGGRAGPAGRPQRARPSPGTRSRCAATSATSPSTRRCAGGARRAGDGAGPGGRGRSARRRRRAVAGAAAARRRHPGAERAPGRAGRRARPRRAPGPATTRGRWCSPRTAGPAGCRRSTSRPRSSRWPGCGCPSTSTTARPQARRDLASTLRNARHRSDAPRPAARPLGRPPTTTELAPAAPGAARSTPATAAPTGRSTPAGPSGTPGCERDTDGLRAEGARPHPLASPARSTGSARCSTARGYLAGSGADAGGVTAPAGGWPGSGPSPTCWSPSASGHGVWDGLSPAELAAVVSALVYESRREAEAPVPGCPRARCAAAVEATRRLWAELEEDEQRHGLALTREPDLGFAWAAYRWARGESLDRGARPSAQAGAGAVRRATSSAGASSCSTCSTSSPRSAGPSWPGPRGRRSPRCAGAWWPRPVRSSPCRTV